VAAALFGAHPLQVEAVAWVAERKTVLAAVFFLAAALAYLRHRRDGRLGWYVASLGLFAAALLSKTAMLTLPLSLLLADRVLDGAWTRASLRRALPYVALAACAAWLTMHAEAEPPPIALLDRPLIAARALWFYAGALIAPRTLVPIHARWGIDPYSPVQWLPLAAALALAIGLWRRQPWGLTHWGVGHFAVTLAPVLALVPYGFTELSFVAERHAYVASIGLLLVAALGLDWLRARRATLATALAVALVVLLAARTVRQIGVWRDGETLWRHQLEHGPDHWLARNNLAMALIAQQRLDEAAPLLESALAIRPHYAEAHNNLALVLYRRGDFANAETHSRAAAGLKPYEAGFIKNLGLTLVAQGQVDAGLIEFRRALALAPDAPDIHMLAADALLRSGQLEPAIAELARVVALAPDAIEAQSQLGRARIAAGRPAEAVAPLTAVVDAAPTDPAARFNLAVALSRAGRTADAIAELDTALKLNPDFEPGQQLRDQLGAAAD
jgi:Flp pilus assembly protein TadD